MCRVIHSLKEALSFIKRLKCVIRERKKRRYWEKSEFNTKSLHCWSRTWSECNTPLMSFSQPLVTKQIHTAGLALRVKWGAWWNLSPLSYFWIKTGWSNNLSAFKHFRTYSASLGWWKATFLFPFTSKNVTLFKFNSKKMSVFYIRGTLQATLGELMFFLTPSKQKKRYCRLSFIWSLTCAQPAHKTRTIFQTVFY